MRLFLFKWTQFKLFVAVLFIPIGGSFAATTPFVLVSDIDDTLKITNVSSKRHAVMNGLFHHDVFLGMSELLQALSTHASEVIYLSGSPSFLTRELNDLLVEKTHFPAGQFILSQLSSWIYMERPFDFKMREFNNLIAASEASPYLVLGDDTQDDPRVFDELISRIGNERVLGAYVHKVTNKELPSTVIPFSTAFDIGLDEFEKGRLSAESVVQIGNVILEANKPELIFPDFVYCPVDYDAHLGIEASKNDALRSIAAQFAAYVRMLCRMRTMS